MFLLGLTGSIGMGKSTTAQMFVDEGCALWDADAAVHRLYAKGGAAVAPFRDAFPAAVQDDAVSREILKDIITQDPKTLALIESIVHPLVGQDRAAFLAKTTSDITVLDIPLLFETGGASKVDAVACVITDDDTQKSRVMERGTMTETQFESIRAKQMPAAKKAKLATYIIQTDTLDGARARVKEIVADIRKAMTDA